MLTNAFGLVAALAWNDVIRNGINKYISAGSGLMSEFIYALVVTVFLVFMTIQLGRFAALLKEREEDGSKDSLYR
jgi:hypothetical protein